MKKRIQSIPYPTYTTIERDALINVLKNTLINNSDTGSVEEYDGTTWVSQSSCGGGSSAITSKTYAELQDLVSNNLLVPESTYIITDYQTKHLISNSDPQEINIGNIEPLTLIAATTNTFYVEVKSSLFPTDIIHYRFDDDSCEDGTRDVENKKWTGGTPRNGYISYRKSTTNNLSTYYDWRNYKIRRWKIDCVEWTPGMIFNSRGVVKSPSNGNIYYANKFIRSLEDPASDVTNFQLFLETTLQEQGGFLSSEGNAVYFNGLYIIDNNNIIINNTTPEVDYKDYYTFSILTEPTNSSGVVLTNINGGKIGEGFKEINIEKFDYEYSRTQTSFLTYGGNVFYLIPNGESESYYKNINIGKTSTNNTIACQKFYNNYISDTCFYNIFTGNINYNKIGSLMFNNIIYNLDNNVINNSFQYNVISDTFQYNIIQCGFFGNYIGGSFTRNKILDSVNTCLFNSNFTNNIILTELSLSPIYIFSSNLYSNYNCTIFNNSLESLRLSYYDENDQLIITDVTA